MIASTLINVPGISAFFTEGYVTYSNEAKVKMIHVKETIERYGVVSAETAADMAVSAARTADTDAALSVTGVAGPDGGTRECPVGLVYIGCCLHGRVVTERHLFAGDRMQVRKSCHRCGASFTCPHDHRGGNHMRIIAGTARSLPLKAPEEWIRDRPRTGSKETLFNIIQDEVPGHISWICLREAVRWDWRQSAEARAMRCLSTMAKAGSLHRGEYPVYKV